ncbi:hypothetical protein ACLHDG_04765 [Sulfurovum sp. CS9]|uniref:hypothetical protein n=1 Tax=Sulfurovum sp. CS9 TaxID=3391146 RepID=UPI0039ED6FBD
MHHLLKIILLVSSILFMQGCATHENFVKRYDSWVGHNINHLMKEIGYPDSTYILPNKNKVYVYARSRIYSVPSMHMMGYGYGGYYGGYGMYGYGYGNDIIQKSCKLFLETNKKGIIIKWGSRGNHCTSY